MQSAMFPLGPDLKDRHTGMVLVAALHFGQQMPASDVNIPGDGFLQFVTLGGRLGDFGISKSWDFRSFFIFLRGTLSGLKRMVCHKEFSTRRVSHERRHRSGSLHGTRGGEVAGAGKVESSASVLGPTSYSIRLNFDCYLLG